jgi:GT2 family glycosyltransferase
MHRPSFDILLVNWNGLADTLACLRSVAQIRYPRFRVVVADNGSRNHEADEIRRQFPDVTVLENGANLGFAGGNNRGIELCLQGDADVILLLNNDTTVDPDMLTAFADAMAAHPDGGVFGAKIYYFSEPAKIWFAGSYWNRKSGGFGHVGINQQDQPRFDQEGPIDYACGCAMAVKREVFQKVGLLDEQFFAVYEESDFCFRARRAGYGCYYVPRAKVWHKISASFQGGNAGAHVQYYFQRNRLLFIRRNMGWRVMLETWARVLAPLLARHLLRLINPGTPAEQRRVSRAVWCGVLDYYRSRLGPGPAWLVSAPKTTS